MARAKKNKRLKTRQSTGFYESLPLQITPPPALPEVSQHLTAGAQAISSKLRQTKQRLDEQRWGIAHLPGLWTHLRTNIWPRFRAGLHQMRQNVSASVMSVTRATAVAGHLGADAAGRYLPPFVGDLRDFLVRTWRSLRSRRARYIYLSVSAAAALAAVSLVAVTAASVMTAYANDIASPAALLSKKKTGTVILDRNGAVLFEGYGAQATKEVPLNEIPKALREATVATEDADFYSHPGFSWRGTARAAWVDITKRGKIEGGSTLTQQLVKNALLTSDKDFGRKAQEILLAFEIEKRYSKDQILEMYLNEIYYGEGASGVEAAAQTYFHKPVSKLTLGESALIAGLPLGPSRFDPNANLEAATGRRNFVLSRMQELGKITKAEAEAAKAQPIKLASAGAPETAPGSVDPMMVYARTINIRAPHFVFYVLDQLRAQYGEQVIEQGGITVTTTLDLAKQSLAEASIAKRVGEISGRNVTNGALIARKTDTGDILAMVGSVDYNAPGFGNVNVTLSERQPGSSFKPFTYAAAFKKGWNGSSTVDDTPMTLVNGDGSPYIPKNYDGEFRGRVTLRQALANSLNIPALKTLQFAGIPETIQTAKDLGITSLNEPNRYGLALTLGGGEVRPIDMTTAYSTFANNGDRVMPRSILEVKDKHGKDITKTKTIDVTKGVIDPRVAYMITNILSDNNARIPEFGANSPLKLSSRVVAAKTGTTNDWRDNWTVGYTPQITTAVWVGNNDNSAMADVTGTTGAGPIWNDFMEGAHEGLPEVAFTAPSGVTVAKICKDGGLAESGGYDEVFLAEAVPTRKCSSYNTSRPLEDKKREQSEKPDETPKPETSPIGGAPAGDEPPPIEEPEPEDTPAPIRTPRLPRSLD
ncbi:MAG: family penicillin-binding protein [Candidatus Saccharibacteria bacterium]|jgi:1A family penicillin-binding protein|nr:family penicillin-binding protein [Candidatus Saccharibacteria bacterium]